MEEAIKSVNDAVNGFVWGPVMLVLLVGTGLFLTVGTGFLQFSKFGYAMKNTLGKIFKKSEAGKGEITPFQAVSTALAATVGTGNIVGVTTAIIMGGPGAVFWMWIAALAGMCTKYAEVLLAVKYRERNDKGDWVGGPMYYIKNGLGKKFKWLGAIFAILGAIAAFGIGNIAQVNSIAGSVNDVAMAYSSVPVVRVDGDTATDIIFIKGVANADAGNGLSSYTVMTGDKDENGAEEFTYLGTAGAAVNGYYRATLDEAKSTETQSVYTFNADTQLNLPAGFTLKDESGKAAKLYLARQDNEIIKDFYGAAGANGYYVVEKNQTTGAYVLNDTTTKASQVNTTALITGILVALFVAIVVIGGVKRIGQVTEKLVPFMAVIYIVCAIVVIIAHAGQIGPVFGMIFQGAFNPTAAVGGLAGFTVLNAMQKGVARGVFSNEAGLGSAPIAHAATSEKDPVKQGLYGIFEVFMDTILICTLTALVVLCSGAATGMFGVKAAASASTTIAGFASVFGVKFGSTLLCVGLLLFATSTILGWALYGSRCMEYLFGTKSLLPYQIAFAIVIVLGATMDLKLVWDVSDTLNGLMAFPNLVGLLLLSPVVIKMTKDYFKPLKK